MCTAGAWVENKGALLTYHYRATPQTHRASLVKQAVEIFRQHGFHPHHTQMAIEARPPVPWGKGRASVYILRTMYGVDWHERVRIVYAGDDETDEDVMETLHGLACSFRVSCTPVDCTAANYRLKNPAAVLSVLRWIQQRMAKRPQRIVSTHPAAGIATKFLITCIHSELNYESDEQELDAGSDVVKRRRRNSKGPPY